MAEEQSTHKGFFTTLPGIITAIAGLITAIGGFILILNKTGCISSKADNTEQHASKDSSDRTQETAESKDVDNSSPGNKIVAYSPAIVKHLTRYLQYKITEATAEALPDGSIVLSVKLKCINNSDYEYHFYASYIGAGVGDDNYGPEPFSPSGNYVAVPPRSFRSLEYNFNLPRGIKNFNLDFYDLDKLIGSSAFTLN